MLQTEVQPRRYVAYSIAFKGFRNCSEINQRLATDCDFSVCHDEVTGVRHLTVIVPCCRLRR
jgi:hypothetical protein